MITKLEFSSLTNDLTFKWIFSKEEFLKDIINSFLEFIGDNHHFTFSSITPESYIQPKHSKQKNYYGDIVAVLDNGDIITLEMYKNLFRKRDYNKSFCYMNRLFDNQIKKGDKEYEDTKKVISINFIRGNFRKMNSDVVNAYCFKNKKTNKIIDEGNTEMYLVRFDLLDKISYNEKEERFLKWLRLINAKTLEEMEIIGKGDEIMEQSIEFVKEWTKEHSGEKAYQEYLDNLRFEAKDEGVQEGLINTAKNMLEDNANIKTIMKYTGLTKKQIEALKN